MLISMLSEVYAVMQAHTAQFMLNIQAKNKIYTTLYIQIEKM